MKKSYCHKFLLIITHASWGHFKYYIDLPTNLESSECLLTSNLNDFLLKLTNFTWNPQMQVNFFLQIIFYKNRIFTKTIFLLNHTSWGYFLDYMNLPYQFGILRMCTFCWFDWFLSKPSIILVIHTNMCALFFSSDLI